MINIENGVVLVIISIADKSLKVFNAEIRYHFNAVQTMLWDLEPERNQQMVILFVDRRPNIELLLRVSWLPKIKSTFQCDKKMS